MFDNKIFRVVRNDGPGAEVTTETVFHFHQHDDIIHVDYWGGGVRWGQMLGLVTGDQIRHRYIQINTAGEFHAGHSLI